MNHHRIVKPLGVIIILLLVIIFTLSYQNKTTQDSQGFKELTVIVNESLTLKTDVSSTSNERTIGLSKYDSLKENQAMLFVFEEKGFYSFWMRDMKFPIDIIWLNENKEIVSIRENADPSEYPQSYYPEAEALYVLETVAGFVTKNQLEKGQQLSW